MDRSLTNFEITESTLKAGSGSENGSDKSENIEILSMADTDPSSNGSHSDFVEFDSNLPETVTLLKDESTGAKLYLVGTAHFSEESKLDVINVIQNIRPNVIILELCPSRINILSLDEKTILEEAKSIDMAKIMSHIKANGVYNGIMYILLLNMSAHITKQLGMAPGGEFRVAYQEAQKINCRVLFGDRPLFITIKRALSRLTWWQTAKLAWHLLTSKDTVSIEDIEKCKKRDMLEQLLAELAGDYPAFREVFLDERDIYLTNSLQAACKNRPADLDGSTEPFKVVGVVGIGHAPGITRLWPHEQSAFIEEIIKVPEPSNASKAIKIVFRVSLLSFGGYLVYRYVSIPRFVKNNAQHVVHKLMENVKSTTSFAYNLQS